ncbi:MAG: ferrous iron transport protein B, partial [Oscillospiraceae bacterium]|nr:ferrous iron transport protein B [Oscillospiraceae bacterium]
DLESIIANERYNYITKIIPKFYKKNNKGLNTSDKIDKIVTNRFLAFPIFIFIMTIIYFISITLFGKLASDWINNVFFGDWIQPFFNNFLESIGSAKWLISLVNDGIIAGVGSVLSFVPQMFILFFFLSVLEDCGYMTRIAFIMDRVFRKFGLSGKSFIPLLISSGCGVPGIMATKAIENEKYRRLTIITTTFIPCSAKLPIISLIGGSIFPNIWYIAPTIYFIGIAAVILSGIMLKKTKPFRGKPTPFVMELPQYHIPSVKSTLFHIWENVRSFIVKAGTIIFLASALIWFLSNFGITNQGFCMVEETKSMLAAIGIFIAPIFAPLGFSNWHATVATISGFFAKENIVSTFGVIMGLSDATETNADLLTNISELFPYSSAALSFLVFNLLCAPCFAAIGTIYKQMSSAKWTLAAITFQTLFAYTLSLIVNQIGALLYSDLPLNIWTIVAFLLVAVMLILIFRPTPSNKNY